MASDAPARPAAVDDTEEFVKQFKNTASGRNSEAAKAQAAGTHVDDLADDHGVEHHRAGVFDGIFNHGGAVKDAEALLASAGVHHSKAPKAAAAAGADGADEPKEKVKIDLSAPVDPDAYNH